MNKKVLNPQWWEKTVEYAFVQNFLPHASLATPLAGNPEQYFGDLLVNTANKWFLIEFKREQESIKDELVKYLKYDGNGKKLTKEELKTAMRKAAGTGHIEWIHTYQKELLDDHKDAIASHFFVYGDYNKEDSRFFLRHLPYWDDIHRVKKEKKSETLEETILKKRIEPVMRNELKLGSLFTRFMRTFPFTSTANGNQMKNYLLALSKLRGNNPTPSGGSGGNALVVVLDAKTKNHIAFGEDALLAVASIEGEYEQEKYINGN